MTRRFIFSIFILLLFSFTSLKANNMLTILVDSANKAYNEGKYSLALEKYNRIEKLGSVSEELFYNIGNTHFKLNNIPSAILYYERAKKMNPANENVNYNLKVANLKIIDKIESLPELFYVRWWNSFCMSFSIDQWAILSIIGFFIFFILVLIYFFCSQLIFRKIGFYGALFFLLFTLMSFISAWHSYSNLKNKSEAIVFSLSVTAKSSPDSNSTDLFVIHEGLKVEILDNIGDWSEIKLANGSRGWIKKASLEII